MKYRHLFGLFAAAILFVAPASAQVLTLGDDDFEAVPIGFTFSLCGTDYDTAYVNSNGSLTFGAGSTSFSDSASGLLGGPPRITGIWDDLNPTQGGVIDVVKTSNAFTANWTDVPEYFSTGANTFSITLKRSSNSINIEIGDLTLTDGLLGVSCGDEITIGNEPGTDASEDAGSNVGLRNNAAYYEAFSFSSPNDLANTSFSFSAPNAFNDSSEPNDALVEASPVQLPFNSGDSRGNSGGLFTAIEPVVGYALNDIDFFRFSANEGETLIAEVTNGGLDTLIGLYDFDTQILLAVNDDGGAGLLSRIVFPIPADGAYALAMSTYPDFNFSGDGFTFNTGRYVLDLRTIDGTLLDLGDDDFESVDFDCAGGFPYQGGTWSSVYVNSNGSLTFGSGDTDFSESVSEFLNEAPRIAPLWDDLSPNNGGLVLVSQTSDSMTVSFQNVPEYFSTGANSFDVTMTCSTGDVSIVYGAISASDGLVGVTEGGFATDPGETDLSAGGPYSAVGTTYEWFSGFDNDLDSETLVFEGP